MRAKLLTLGFFIICTSAWGARGNWNIGDWVSWGNFRYVSSIASDYKYVYLGTTGGVLRLDRFMRNFEDPWTESDGLANNWVERIYYNQPDDEVVIDTKSGLFS